MQSDLKRGDHDSGKINAESGYGARFEGAESLKARIEDRSPGHWDWLESEDKAKHCVKYICEADHHGDAACKGTGDASAMPGKLKAVDGDIHHNYMGGVHMAPEETEAERNDMSDRAVRKRLREADKREELRAKRATILAKARERNAELYEHTIALCSYEMLHS